MRYFFGSLFLLAVLPAQAREERFGLYRLTPNDAQALNWMRKLEKQDHKYKVDFWRESARIGDSADVMLSDKALRSLMKPLSYHNITMKQSVADVEKLIMRNEGKHDVFGPRLRDDPILDSEPDTDHSRVGELKKAHYPFGDYSSYSEMIKYMRTIEFYYPKITKIIRLGTTHEGKPIEGLKIGLPSKSGKKRGVWVDGNIHAREWASSHTALYIINQLVSGYGKDETITHYVNSMDFYVVPCLNPDGYEYTRSSPHPAIRLWRKNRSPKVCRRSLWGGEKCCKGVDLNRNFDFHWSKSGSSYEPCSNIYHGEKKFSEPESRAVNDFLSSNDLSGQVDAFITLHSYAQLWIYPYSHEEQNYPEDVTELRKTAHRAISRLRRMYGTEYRMGTGADTLTPAAGGSDDWAKKAMGIKYVYLIELRPEMELSNGFILHKKELIPTAVETFEGIKEVFEAVLEHNNIKRDPLSKISPNLRKKQLYRLRLLGLASQIDQQPKGNLTSITDFGKNDLPHRVITTTTRRPKTTTTARPTTATTTSRPTTMTTTKRLKTTTAPSDFTAMTYPRVMTHRPVTRRWNPLRSKHFRKLTTTPREVPVTTTTKAAVQQTTVRPRRRELFYTYTKPTTFLDPDCRDMRYSCGFWLSSNKNVCKEQASFMKAQCSYTCDFCISKINPKPEQT